MNFVFYLCSMDSHLKKIIDCRKAKGITQKDLAGKLGINQVNYSNLENGKTSLTVDKILKIAEILDVPIIYFFGNESEINELNNKVAKKETDRLKVLAFHSLDKIESNQIFLKQFEHDQENPEDWKKFEEYRQNLSEFKKGILEKLIEVGFCTQEEIKEYKDHIYKQANERMFVKKDEDPAVKETLEEVTQKEMDQEKLMLQQDPNFIPKRFYTSDGRPFNRKDIVISDGKTIITFNHPDQELITKEGEETAQTLRDINNAGDESLDRLPDKTETKNIGQ